MNDDTNLNQNSNPVAQTTQAQPQPIVQPVAPPIQVPAQPTPVSGVNKETGPISAPVSEFVKPTEVQPQISQELKDLGVEAKKDEPNVTDEHKHVIDHAKQFSPVPNSPTGKVTMPMTEVEVADKLKTGQDDDSAKGLAKLIQKVIKAMGFSQL